MVATIKSAYWCAGNGFVRTRYEGTNKTKAGMSVYDSKSATDLCGQQQIL